MKRPPVLHPFLFALFPTLALYAYNIKSIPVPLRELAGPLVLSLAATAVLFAAFAAIVRSPAKAGLMVSVIVLWFLSFGRLAGWISLWTEGLYSRSLFFATALLVALAVLLIGRSRRDPGGLTRVLNVVSATLVLLNVASTAQSFAGRPRVAAGPDVTVSGPAAGRPNIYYIVLDAYTRADILKEIYSFDNSAFLRGLESRGFVVTPKSYANYGWTYHSLASSLNMAYIDPAALKIGGRSADQEPLYRMIQDNKVMSFLKSRGYEVLCFSSSFKPGDIKRADRTMGFEGTTSEFRTAFLNTTPLPMFLGLKAGLETYGAHRSHILDAFRTLEASAAQKGPFFFFVHLMSPHPPFVFGPDGEPVEPDYLFSLVDADLMHGGGPEAVRDYISHYRDQVSFLDKKLLHAVDVILSRSTEPPIIILQGDHGSRAYASLDRPEACFLKENLAILNAYYLPGGAGALVYPEITPVNTFRLIFKRYFGAEMNLLEDKSAWCTWRRPYTFIPFDERTYEGTVETVKAAGKPKPPIVKTK
jgi:hypothetical protein